MAIPDRWLNYTPIGQRVEGTRFVAFKVPLREAVIQNVQKPLQLDASILLKSIPNLGMIIDLTNTNRYYRPDSFVKKGLEYNKLMIPGHHTPAPHLVEQFKKMVINFLSKNSDNDKLIGVHCTHGVNRTGYLICNYMISELDMKPQDAIDKFNLSRGHKIERKNYIDSLHGLKKTPSLANKSDNSERDDKPVNEPPSKEPISWRAMQLPQPPPSPKEFDKRDRFERFRQEAKTQTRSYTSVATARPARQISANTLPKSNPINRHYSRPQVSTSRNYAQGGASYPLHNHHNYDAPSRRYVDYARHNHRYEANTYQRRYALDNHAPQSSSYRHTPYRRI